MYGTIVVGGGVVGLSSAAAAAAAAGSKHGPTLVLEQHSVPGQECSSRNSEVVHAGLYYPKDSMKAFHCIRGNRLLRELSRRSSVTLSEVGKWIVSTSPEEESQLEAIAVKARECDVPVSRLSRAELSKEPLLSATAGLLSPTSSIVNSHELMLHLVGELEENGGSVVCNSKVIRIKKVPEGFSLSVLDTSGGSGGEETTVTTRTLVLAGGLHGHLLTRMIPSLEDCEGSNIYYTKGHYFAYRGPKLLQTPKLVYPIPDARLRGLGIHGTVDLQHRLRFGPDVVEVDNIDYSFPSTESDFKLLRSKFLQQIQTYFPSVEDSHLVPDYTGIRPKLFPAESMRFQDFLIEGESVHGVPGLVNLTGIESPGLTSALSIGETVRNLLYPELDLEE